MQRIALSLLLAAALLPGTASAWNVFGQHEPNTVFDQNDGWMYSTTDTSSDQNVRQVYFASWVDEYPGTAVNPNVAATGSAVNPPIYAYWSMLGVWKDCNNDGFVGFGEQGILEYRSEVLAHDPLAGGTICPVQATPDPIPLNWFPSHNDGNWVRELLPIQWLDLNSGEGDHNPWNVNANGARVWVDEGLPGNVPGATCAINPQPAGTYRSTGGALGYADCFSRYTITDGFDGVADSNAALRPYSFSDHPRDQYNSASKANVHNPWGSESDASDVQAWDCSRAQLVSGQRPLPNGGWVELNVSQPAVPPGVSQSGSAAGTANATGSGFDQCTRNTNNDGGSDGARVPSVATSRSHPGDTLAHVPYTNEGGVNTAAKIGTFTMAPIEERRTNNTFAALLGPSTPQDLGTEIGGDYGTTQVGFNGQPYGGPSVNSPVFGSDGLWFTVPNLVSGPRGFYLTAYAYVDPAAINAYHLSLPGTPFGQPLTTGTYGADNCGGFTTGVHKGWDCDATHWYFDATGKDISKRSIYLGQDPRSTLPCTETPANAAGCLSYDVRVGAPFGLRAIACYDESTSAARAAGVSWDDTSVVTSQAGRGGANCQFATS